MRVNDFKIDFLMLTERDLDFGEASVEPLGTSGSQGLGLSTFSQWGIARVALTNQTFVPSFRKQYAHPTLAAFILFACGLSFPYYAAAVRA